MLLKSTDTKLYKWIDEHKITMIISLSTLIITTIITAFFTEITTKFSQDYLNKGNGVEYVDELIAPLFTSDPNKSIEEVKEYSNNYNSEILSDGCAFNTYVKNKKDSSVIISETAIIIDSIDALDELSIFIMGIYSINDNMFTVYAINNDLKDFSYGHIELSGYLSKYDENIIEEKISDEAFECIFQSINNNSSVISIDNLKGGEIRKIDEIEIVSSYFKNNSSIDLKYQVYDDSNGKLMQDLYFGVLVKRNNIIEYVPSEIGAPDNIVERVVVLDTEKLNINDRINIPSNIPIKENETINILYNIFPTSSCNLSFHASIKCAGEDEYIESNRKEHKIYVPLYKTDYYAWDSIRNFIKKYNIENYYYNSNPIIQEEIDYHFYDYYEQYK